MKNLVRKSFLLTVLLISAGVGSAAHALPIIDGIFSLVNDRDGPYAAGELIATGSFTTEDTDTVTGIGAMSGFDIVPLVELSVIDRTANSGFGNISYNSATAGNYWVISTLYALFDQTSLEFVGLQGTIMDLSNDPMLALTLNGTVANFGGARFGFSNLSSSLSESGFQVPEPGIPALLGIALIAFGFVRRKASA